MGARSLVWVVTLLTLVSWGALGQERRVAINEVAWGGTVSDRTDEWIELANTTSEDMALAGWKLLSSDGGLAVFLSGTISASGFFVLERADGPSAPTLHPSLLYHGALTDGGEALWLLDSDGKVVDTANREAGRWPAGTNQWGTPLCCSMERVDPTSPDAPSNWATHRSEGGGGPVCGSPGSVNSVYNLIPRVAFSFSPDPPHPGETVRFDATASIDPNGAIRSFQWDFGDGTTAEGETVGHTFTEARVYAVTLTTTDDQGASSSLTRSVDAVLDQPPAVDFSVQSSPAGQVPRSLDPLQFIDESYDPDDDLVAWSWDFGDGAAAQGEKAVHTYAHSGTYTVTLTVAAKDGATGTQTQVLRVDPPLPVAAFDFSPAVPNEQGDVTFDASRSYAPEGTITSYEWDFDPDGSIDLTTPQTEAHYAFAQGGDRTVTLWVVDDAGGVSNPTARSFYVNRRPTPAFQLSNLFPNELEPVLFTDQSQDPDGSVVAWLWTFGDGSTGSSPSQTHAYSEAGSYKVVLQATDNLGAVGGASAEVTVQDLPPIAAVLANGSASQATVSTGDSVSFDASSSRDQSPEGKIEAYGWDLVGDGTFPVMTTTPILTHSYPDDGTFTVRVRVTDNGGSTAVSDAVTMIVTDRPPAVTFTWSPSPPLDGLDVAFSAMGSDPDGTILSWSWSFGDGGTASVQSPVHRFQEQRTYDVTVTVVDDDGTLTTLTQQVAVGNAPPVAAFDLAPSAPHVGEAVTFTDRSYDPSPTGGVVHVAWNFGDGVSCPGQETGCGAGPGVSHTYSAAGTYTVELVVIDNKGALARVTRAVIVSP